MNQLIEIKYSEFETRIPKTNESFFQNLTSEEKNDYLLLYSLYSNLLYHFLIEKLELKKYDDMLKNSENRFYPIAKDNMDLYQKLSTNFFNYLYIRNNIYIERLSDSEKEFLKNKIIDDNIIYDQASRDFIEKTYAKVIVESLDNFEQTNINYGPDNYNFIKSANALIIGIRFDNYHKDFQESDLEWSQYSNKRSYQINLLIDFFKMHYMNTLDIPCYMVQYNDFSINRIQNMDDEKIV